MEEIFIIFDSSNNASALVSDAYQGPLIRYGLPDNFDANNWTNYILTTNGIIMIASTDKLSVDCQNHLDAFAQTKGYSNIMSACSYANSTNAIFKLEGTYAVGARDNTWSTLYNIFAEVSANTRPPIGSFSQIVDELPPLKWPDESNLE